MPKPFGEGLEYFQVDVDIHDHWKMELLRDKFKDAGVSFWLFTHCRLFNNSYYVELSDHFVDKFCNDVLEKPIEEFMAMLEFSVDHKIFYKPYYEEFGILTSRGIQARYLEISKRWARVKMIHDYVVPKVNIFNYELTFYNRDGDYIGYKKKGDKVIINETYVPRKHVAKEKITAEIVVEEEKHTKKIPDNFEETITEYHYNNPQLEKDILSYWGFNQIAHKQFHTLVVHFLTVLNNNDRIDEFVHQFSCYKEYKDISHTDKHRFENFIGHQDKQFKDAKWQDANWEHELDAEKKKSTKKTNGSHQTVSKAQQAISSHDNFVRKHIPNHE